MTQIIIILILLAIGIAYKFAIRAMKNDIDKDINSILDNMTKPHGEE